MHYLPNKYVAPETKIPEPNAWREHVFSSYNISMLCTDPARQDHGLASHLLAHWVETVSVAEPKYRQMMAIC